MCIVYLVKSLPLISNEGEKPCLLKSRLVSTLKTIFYKNNAKPSIVTRNLHDSAPYFGACLPEIGDRIVEILWENRRLCVILIKNRLYNLQDSYVVNTT